MKKKYVLLFSILVITLAILLLIFKPIDKEPYTNTEFYKQTKSELNFISAYTHASKRVLRVGWAKGNFTPDIPQRLSGYGIRSVYTQVIDSALVNVLAFDNGLTKGFFLSYDLLIIHKDLRIQIEKALENEQIKSDFLFFTATHTHHGTSGWASGLGGLMVGGYDDEVMQKIVKTTIETIKTATKNLSPSKISYQELKTDSLVYNRLEDEGKGYKDELLRWLVFENENKKKAILTIFSAHATCLWSTLPALSGDYPSACNQYLMQKANFDMAMFASGGVASHSAICGEDTLAVKSFGQKIAQKIISFHQNTTQDSLFSFRYEVLPLKMRVPQFRVNDDFVINPTIFEAGLGEMSGKIQVLQMNNIVLMGYPCDISGELYPQIKPVADSLGLKFVMTSFNGDYVGYVSDAKQYEKHHFEVRDMNWIGHDAGDYFVEMSKELLRKLKD